MFVDDTSVLSTSSTYLFEMSIGTSIPSGGKIALFFNPNAFALTPGANLPCTAIYGFGNSATCTVSSDGQFVELTTAFATTDFLLIFSIQGITNPSYVATWSIPAYSYADSTGINGYTGVFGVNTGAAIEYSGSSNFSFRTTPGTMTTLM